MHIRSRRSAGPHAIRNRVVAFLLAFVQNNHMCNQRYSPGLFANRSLHLGVYVRYAQVPQHVAISLIFRTTVDQKKSVEVLPIGLCIYRIFLSCPSTCGFGLQGQLCLPYLEYLSLEVHTCSLVLGCRSWLQDRIGECYIRKTNSIFKLRHETYLRRQVGKNKLIVTNRQKRIGGNEKQVEKNYSPSFFRLSTSFFCSTG